MLKIVALLLLLEFSTAEKRPLSKFVTHFEELNYNHHDLMEQHRRVSRSIAGKRNLELKFEAFGKNFQFHLYPNTRIYSDDFKISVNGRSVRSVDQTNYHGYAVGDSSIRVHGDVSRGFFTGSIRTSNEHFHIEPASLYFDEEKPFHSVMYRSSDIDYSQIKGSMCGLNDKATFENLQAQQLKLTEPETVHNGRTKRQDRTRTVCKLSLIGDQRFYELITSNSFTQEQRVTQAKAYLTNLVNAVNVIYESTNFVDTPAADGIRFVIGAVEITTTDPANFQDPFIEVQSYLDRHSNERDHSDYCLAYRFTARDFDRGVLGLAYVARIGATGGVCASRLNTGIVTLVNFGSLVAQRIVELTFAHELGHNFGSEHDPMQTGGPCSPGDSTGGNYIMFPSASRGNLGNNDDFSTCSINYIRLLIDRSQGPVNQGGCFIEDPGTCGNGAYEPGLEECDCGFDFDQAGVCENDKCCNGMTCNLTANSTCSPSQGECCTTECSFESTSFVCRSGTDCIEDTLCDGMSAACPMFTLKPEVNGTISCNNNTGTCDNTTGICTGSICPLLGMQDCLCTGLETACHVCCKNGEAGECMTTEAILMANPNPNVTPRQQQPGGFCLASGGNVGFCDFLGRCRLQDADGALNRLQELFNSAAFQSVINFIINMWWVLIIVVVVVLVILFVIVIICHFTLPKPKHMKQRQEYRNTLRRGGGNRQGGGNPGEYYAMDKRA